MNGQIIATTKAAWEPHPTFQGIWRKLLTRTADGIEVQLLRIDPGEAIPPHRHAEDDDLSYILEGAGKCLVNDQERICSAGDLIHAPAGALHTTLNDGTVPLLVLLHKVRVPRP